MAIVRGTLSWHSANYTTALRQPLQIYRTEQLCYSAAFPAITLLRRSCPRWPTGTSGVSPASATRPIMALRLSTAWWLPGACPGSFHRRPSVRVATTLSNTFGVRATWKSRWFPGERWRNACARLALASAAFFLPVGIGTRFAADKEIRVVNGVECVYEPPLRGDFALIRASRADGVGNLVYAGAQRGWNSAVVSAARVAIAEVDEVAEPGGIDPERVITPGIFVNRIVRAGSPTIG